MGTSYLAKFYSFRFWKFSVIFFQSEEELQFDWSNISLAGTCKPCNVDDAFGLYINLQSFKNINILITLTLT